MRVGKGAFAPCPPSRTSQQRWARGACHRARIRATRWLCPPYKVSTERALQIEAAVSRLLGRDRAVRGKQAPAEHVVAGAVDRLDADELPGFVAERRERPLRTIA